MKDRVFRDPVHGLIEFVGADRPLCDILETRAVQRLRRIHQMGFAWLVYPGAEHSRFSHALGAFHIASRVAERLALEPRVARHVRVAALLHDVGHGPFSHAWEHVFPEGDDHERWGARLVSEDAELRAVLEGLEPGLPATLRSFWDKTYRPLAARKLVSSQLDVDRLDYLLRDGHYSGAGYATFDLEWILHALQVRAVRSGDDPDDLVVDYRRGMYAVEQYLFARSYMYAQVYHHKTVRAAELMFLELFARFRALAAASAEPDGLAPVAALARGQRLAVDDYLWLDDQAVLGALDRWAGRVPGAAPADDAVLRDLAARLIARKLFKTIELGHDPAVLDRVGPAALEVARRRFGEAGRHYLHLDHTTQVHYRAAGDPTSKGFSAGNAEDEELWVVGHPTHDRVTLGQLYEALPLGTPRSTIRLVCAPELVDELRPLAAAATRGPTS
jgi:HD superfamily phosphohydrolase